MVHLRPHRTAVAGARLSKTLVSFRAGASESKTRAGASDSERGAAWM